MRIVILAEHEKLEVLLVVDDWQRVNLVVPDDVVGLIEVEGIMTHDELLEGGHKLLDLAVLRVACGAVVTAGDDAEQLAVGSAVVGDSDCGIAGLCLQCNHISERVFGREVGVGNYKTCLVFLHLAHHLRLVVDGLRTVNERNAAVFGKRNRHIGIRHRLHNSRCERNVERERRCFALLVLDKRRLKVDVGRGAILGCEPRNQQVLVESPGNFVDYVCHGLRFAKNFAILIKKSDIAKYFLVSLSQLLF